MYYIDLIEKLGKRDRRKLQNNTYLERRDNGALAVALHSTDVLTFYPSGHVTLNTGGWLTRTTADRINTYLPAGIYLQGKIETCRSSADPDTWYLRQKTASHPHQATKYHDGITIFIGLGPRVNTPLKLRLA